MIDREKTISGLNEIADYFRKCRLNASFGSKAEEHFWDLQIAAMSAAEMLKEQEPIEPKRIVDEHGQVLSCGNCGAWFEVQFQKYCHECGRKVKWDD